MAYVNVADWKSDQVADWLKGLDSVILPYIKYFIETDINGQKLLDMQPNDLDKIGVRKIGHQELILEAVDLLRNFHYELDKENVQLLALRLSCCAHNLYKEIMQNHLNSSTQVPTKILTDVASTVATLKPLVNWLNRPPFCGQPHYINMKNNLLKLALEIVTSGQRDRFAENPVENIFESAKQLAQHADHIIQESQDSLILQPATLDVATLKKRSGESLGFYIVPSFHGVHQVGEVKCNSVAHQCGKIEAGDEIVQVNYQTVVGWQARQVMALLEEASNDIFLTLKKRPKHSKVFGQIYMKPYRLPSKKIFNYPQRYFDQLTPPRPSDLLTIPNFSFPVQKQDKKKAPKVQENQLLSDHLLSPPPVIHLGGRSISPEMCSHSNSSSGDESELESANCSSPTSVRLYLPKPHIPVQRRATISGASPIGKHAPFNFDQLWLKQANEAHNNTKNNADKSNSEMQLSKHSKPTKVHWTSLPANEEKLENQKFSEKNIVDNSAVKDDVLSSTDFISLKERINQLKINTSPEHIVSKKPKIMPKPIVTKPNEQSSITKVRGKLDKSFSTPSYDFSVVSNSQNEFEDFTSDLRMSAEDVKNYDKSEVIGKCYTNLDKSRRPDKPVLTFPKPPPTKIDDCEIPLFVDDNNINFANKKVKPNVHTPQLLPPKFDEINSNASEDTQNNFDIVPHNYKPFDLSDRKDVKIDNSFLFEQNKSDYIHNLPKSYTDYHIGNTTYDNVAIQVSNDRVPNSIESSKYSINRLKNISANSKTNDLSDFEKTSFSDLSDACPPLSLTDLSGSDDNIFQVEPKDNISLPSERTAITPHQAVLNAPATFPRQKTETKKSQPPLPPPRPSKTIELPKRTSYRAMLGAKAIGKKENKGKLCQRNPLIAKRRNISIKDLGICEYQGWLYQRSKKISPRMQWIRGWFIIKGTAFYGFNNRESTKARLMIILSGFTVSVADEVKSRANAFKVYHMGTMFYFAAESSDDLAMWLDWFSTATSVDGHNSNVEAVSETDGEEDNLPDENQGPMDPPITVKPETSHETNFTSSALKNISTFISSHMGSHSTGNSASQKNKNFHSLKKQQKKNLSKEDQAKGSSLDRKHWKFLGMGMIGRDSSEPVPTSQYRSYRRVPPTVPKYTAEASVSTNYNQNSDIYPLPQANHNRPPDMVDYRLASMSKTSDNNHRRTDSTNSSEMTLESFMQSRQEAERRIQNVHMALRVPQYTAPPPPASVRNDQNQQFLDQTGFRIAAESEPRSRQPITALTSIEHNYNLNVLPTWITEGSSHSNDLNGNRSTKNSPFQLYSNRYSMDQISDNESLEYPPVFDPETYSMTEALSRRRDRSNNNLDLDCPQGNSYNFK
ncbi:connector enhancer of kinase suppressor of ras 2 [Adelges cooleyi]|uniref:connector enhancer of kinase suppressor of ras 2 n=1 Tax=Adelges cooleyi TaxID=133065 RepID=UPI002180246C|nr:connector enhancer of kinase suppressor of ras 2 [Adelges cooleyi]XP_050432071.1 connector enhancer of kinase suppressor of ras 2 [Adelges cooleyi]